MSEVREGRVCAVGVSMRTQEGEGKEAKSARCGGLVEERGRGSGSSEVGNWYIGEVERVGGVLALRGEWGED